MIAMVIYAKTVVVLVFTLSSPFDYGSDNKDLPFKPSGMMFRSNELSQ
jgi:hypothetical protein